jgi:inorganic pyrophosphatase/exopolyphosphatase
MDTSSGVDWTPAKHSTDAAASIQRRDYKMFTVNPDTFRKFQVGKSRWDRWSKYLDESDECHAAIKEYAQKYPKNTLVLQCNETGAMRQIRRRGKDGL